MASQLPSRSPKPHGSALPAASCWSQLRLVPPVGACQPRLHDLHGLTVRPPTFWQAEPGWRSPGGSGTGGAELGVFRWRRPSFAQRGGFRWRSQWSPEAGGPGSGAALEPQRCPAPRGLFLITTFTSSAHQAVLDLGATNCPRARFRVAGCHPFLCPRMASAGPSP